MKLKFLKKTKSSLNIWKIIYKGGINLELTNKEMYEINGGASWGVIAAIASCLVFIVGALSGYTNPSRCNN